MSEPTSAMSLPANVDWKSVVIAWPTISTAWSAQAVVVDEALARR